MASEETPKINQILEIHERYKVGYTKVTGHLAMIDDLPGM
jgi:hypothetical protein